MDYKKILAGIILKRIMTILCVGISRRIVIGHGSIKPSNPAASGREGFLRVNAAGKFKGSQALILGYWRKRFRQS